MVDENTTIKISKKDYEIIKELVGKEERSIKVIMHRAIETYKRMSELQEKYYSDAGLVNLEHILGIQTPEQDN